MAIVRIPTPLRPMAGGKEEVEVKGATVAEVIRALDELHPGFLGRLCDASGEPRRFINLYVNESDIRARDGMRIQVGQGDTVSIIPAIAGGSDGNVRKRSYL